MHHAQHVGGVHALAAGAREHGDDLAERLELPRALLDRLGVVPSYYLRYYYAHDEVVRELKSQGTRAEEVLRIEAELGWRVLVPEPDDVVEV